MIYRSDKSKKKISMLAICLLLTVVLAVSGTLAYLFTQSDAVTNTFIPVLPDITVYENIDGNVKKNVTIKNTGEVDSFIRAKVIVTWQDADGNIYPVLPVAGKDYSITWNTSEGVTADVWKKASDGYYYYTSYVPVGGHTGVLFTDATPIVQCADNRYTLHIEVIAQSIQYIPDNAVNQTWPLVTANNGVLTAVN